MIHFEHIFKHTGHCFRKFFEKFCFCYKQHFLLMTHIRLLDAVFSLVSLAIAKPQLCCWISYCLTFHAILYFWLEGFFSICSKYATLSGRGWFFQKIFVMRRAIMMLFKRAYINAQPYRLIPNLNWETFGLSRRFQDVSHCRRLFSWPV